MAFAIRRPILVGGLGLTFSLWLLESLHPSTTSLGGSIVWMAVALGSGFWWFKQRVQQSDQTLLPALPLDRAIVEQELTKVEQRIQALIAELPNTTTETDSPVPALHHQLSILRSDLDRKQARLAIMGGKGVGKTTLTQRLASGLTTTPATDITPSHTSSSSVAPNVGLGATDMAEVSNADLVIFVTVGDLTASEFQAIHQLTNRQQRALIALNKQDQYLPSEREVVLQHLRDRLQGQIDSKDIVAIAAQPSPIKVRRHATNGTLQESVEQLTPDITALIERVNQTLRQEGQRLILATVMRQAKALTTTIQTQLNQVRRDRALPLIEQSQWIAAATAFANPVPSLDLLATAAINTQLVLDLGNIYQQSFSLQQARTIAGNMAELMIKLGLVELSSQAIAPLLKSNAVTYVAGGLLQGISAAYLTRIAALSLITYFEEHSQSAAVGLETSFQLNHLTQKLKTVFENNQRTTLLQTLINQGVSRLLPASNTPAST